MRPAVILIIFCSAFLFLMGCHNAAQKRNTPSPISTNATPLFEDVSARAGIRFTHTNGARGKFHYVEFSPAGCAFLDYDNDGWLDILLLQSGASEPAASVKERPHCGLYHNNGDGTFTDVTVGSGLDKDLGYLQGVAVGDYDNDGYEDLFLTAYGGNHLLHNEKGSGRFTDVTEAMGLDKVHSTGYATSAAFGDYDNDGKLDLYICYYGTWNFKIEKPCLDARNNHDYCPPGLYDPDSHQLFHNDGTHFTDVSAKAGINKAEGRGLAVAFMDCDNDGRPDIFVANDVTPNLLWHNNGNGTFTDIALQAGCAYTEGASSMAGMGIAVADYDHSGRESLFVTNFSDLPNALFKNVGDGLFQDVSLASGVALPHMKYLSFGCDFLDYDNDGWPDLLIANGHVYVNADTRLEGVTYKEPKQLLHNEGNGTFREVKDTGLLGELVTPLVARGLAIGDFDNDGRVDALFNNQNGPAQLFHNNAPGGNHWIAFKTIGVKSNRDGMQAKFTLKAGSMTQTAEVRTGSSYLSARDRRVYFGLGKATVADRVEIRWPSGQHDTLQKTAADTI